MCGLLATTERTEDMKARGKESQGHSVDRQP
jgi:hypothetical protein